MLKKTLFLTLTALHGAAMALMPADIDVLGVKPGMTFEQATAAIKANGPQFTFTAETRYRDLPGLKGGGVAQMYYCDKKMTGLSCPGDEVQFQVGMSTKVVHYIKRHSSFGRLAEKSVREALFAKYGNQAHKMVSNSAIQWQGRWYWDSTGKPTKGGTGCESDSLHSTEKGCGLALKVYSLGGGPSHEINSAFEVEVLDHVLLIKEIEQEQAAKKAAEAADLKRAMGSGGPKL